MARICDQPTLRLIEADSCGLPSMAREWRGAPILPVGMIFGWVAVLWVLVSGSGVHDQYDPPRARVSPRTL